jgi:hypothetical protein
VGGTAFHNLITDYLLAHPSRHWSLRYLGAAMPAFLDTHDLAGAYPGLGDLARLEWARIDVFDAADAPVLTRAALTQGPAAAEGRPLRLIPACQVLALNWNVAPIWRAVEAATAEEEMAHATHSAAVGETGHDDFLAPLPVAVAEKRRSHLLVWRRQQAVLHRSIDAVEQACLAALAAGPVTLAALGQIILEAAGAGEAAAAVEAATRRLARLVSGWLEGEFLQAADGR